MIILVASGDVNEICETKFASVSNGPI